MSYRWTTPQQASGRIRTGDLLITNQVLYQLSYQGKRTKRRTRGEGPTLRWRFSPEEGYWFRRYAPL